MWFFGQTGLRRQELRTGSMLRLAIEESRQLSLDQRFQALQLLDDDPRWLNAVSPGGSNSLGEDGLRGILGSFSPRAR